MLPAKVLKLLDFIFRGLMFFGRALRLINVFVDPLSHSTLNTFLEGRAPMVIAAIIVTGASDVVPSVRLFLALGAALGEGTE